MAAYFPCQVQHSYLLDPACSIPNTPAERLLMQPQQFGEIMTTASSSCFPSYMFFSPEASSVATAPAVRAYDNGTIRSSSSGVNNAPPAYEHLPLVVESHDDDIVPNQEGHMQIKRKSRDVETSLIATTESKDIKELGKSKKQKRLRGGTKKEEEKTPKTDDDQKPSSKASNLNASDGYVHVRARRGQATDSHSLAERVRREKISDRMKMLQGLVPGCDKVTGKALMLDEIINYVQSLQNQVEFLSMKIASLSPILYDFNVDYFDYINQPQKVMRSIPQPLPAGEQGDHLQVNDGTANYQVMAHAAAPLLHVQECTSFPQDGGSGSGTALQVGGPSQGFLGQVEFLNICPFQ